MISYPCKEADYAPDMRDKEPGLGTGDGFLPILRHYPTAPQPGEGSLDDPAAWDDLETLCFIRAFDDLQRPASDLFQRALQLWPCIAAISEYMAEQRIGRGDGLQEIGRTIPILNISTMNSKNNQKSGGIGDDVALATLDL